MVRATQAAAVMALACAVPASGQAPAHGLRGSQPAKPSHVPRPPAPALEPAGRDARAVMAWIVASGDNRGLPYMVIDKVDARVFAFDAQGARRGTAPALLGLGRGDDSAPGIGTRKLAMITPAERTTPAGRFEAALGFDLEQDVLWIDYDAALSMHRVIVGNPADHRRARLASPSPGDNRISYGCINVPARFYDTVVAPLFKGTVGIVYILPETRSIEAAFAMHGEPPPIAPIR
jgi:hypothetical protein